MTKINGAGNTGDIAAEDAVGYDHKAEKGAKAYVNVRVDGSVDENFKWLNHDHKKIADPALKAATECIQDLEAAIKQAYADGKPHLAESLETQLGQVNDMVNGMKDIAENKYNINGHALLGKDLVSKAVTQLNTLISDVRATGVMEQAIPEGTESSKTLTSATGSETKSSEMNEDQKADFLEHVMTASPMDLTEEFGADPKGMWDKLAQLDPKDRQYAMMQLQAGTQENNQLFSTLTNFMKAMHDTEKAISSNLRV